MKLNIGRRNFAKLDCGRAPFAPEALSRASRPSTAALPPAVLARAAPWRARAPKVGACICTREGRADRCRAIACFVGFCARWTPLAPGRGGSRHAFAPAPAHERVRGRCDGRRRLPAAELPCSTRAPSGPPGALRAPQRRPHGFETRAGCDSGREGRRGEQRRHRSNLGQT